ncbi:hypothetical protein V8C35DRAFT_332635, partial [Trichoderma chlorosporum]
YRLASYTLSSLYRLSQPPSACIVSVNLQLAYAQHASSASSLILCPSHNIASFAIAAYNLMMNIRGITMSPLQLLCGAGRHDIAELHDKAQDLRNIPWWLEVCTFLEENSRKLETDGTSQEDNGEPSAPGSSPLSTKNNGLIASPALVQTVSEHPNILFAYAGGPWYNSLVNPFPTPFPNTTVGVTGPYIPGTGSWMVYGTTGFQFLVPNAGRSATNLVGSSAGLPIWSHATLDDGLSMMYPGTIISDSGSENSSQAEDECLEGCPVHMSCFIYHKFFQVWDSTAVEVHRSAGCLQVAASLASRDAESKSPAASCRARADSISYVAASSDGTEGFPPLPKAVPSVPSPAGCICGRHDPSVRKADAYKHCSVKIYLASMEGKGDAKHFSVQNDKMHFNQMIELQLDVETLARRVAVSLAILHWVVKVDARGVQFSLHSTWKSVSGPPRLLLATGSWHHELPDAQNRSITKLRIAHFEEARFIKMDESGVLKAVTAARKSLHIPKPKQRLEIQKRMWDAFVTSYIGASDYLLRVRMETRLLRLPRLFIHHMIQEQPYTS